MPRRIFPASAVTNTTGAPLRLTFHTTSTTGRRETDLWTVDGSNNLVERIPNGVILTDASGAYGAFAGPDDIDTLYVGANGGSRSLLTATGYVSSSVVDAGLGSTGVINRSALLPWYAALANRNSARAVWLAHGDSVSCGARASTMDNYYGRIAQKNLLNRYAVTGSPACGYYVPAGAASGTAPASPTTVTGVWATGGLLFGPGFNNSACPAGAGSITFTVTGTSANLWFGRGGSSSQVTVQVDGGTANPFTIPARPGATTGDGYLLNVSLGSAGSHTVKVTWVSGQVYLPGIDVFNGDESAGVHLIPAGHGGYQVTDFLTADNNGAGTSNLAVVASTAAPHLITIMQTINDWRNATQTSAQYKANLQTLITRYRVGAPNAAILLVACYQPVAGTSGEAYSAFVQACYAVAAADPTVALLDISSRMPAATAARTYGLYNADQIHAADAGHAMLGDALTAALSPA